MDYQSVISDAWKLFKSGKKFTIFLVGIISIYYTVSYILGIVGGLAFIANNPIMRSVRVTGDTLAKTPAVYNANINALIIIPIFCVLLLGGIAIWIIQTGVYKAFAEKFKNNTDMSYREILKAGLKNFLKVFVAQFIVCIPIVLVTILIFIVLSGLGIGTYSANPENTGTFALLSFIVICLSVIVLIPLTLLFSTIVTTIENAILVDGMGIRESISFSYAFAKKHFVKMILLFLLGLLLSFVVSIPLFCVNLSFGIIQSIVSVAFSAPGSISSTIPETIISFISELIRTLYTAILSIYFVCYWIVSYLKLKKLGETVKVAEISK